MVPTEIIAALIIGILTGIPTFVAALASWRRAKAAVAQTSPNGHGTLVQMSERQLIMLGEISGKLDAHVEDPHAHRLNQHTAA